jgi:hypothetical protein
MKGQEIAKDWEIIADDLSKAGWSWGCASALNCEERTISLGYAKLRNRSHDAVIRVYADVAR